MNVFQLFRRVSIHINVLFLGGKKEGFSDGFFFAEVRFYVEEFSALMPCSMSVFTSHIVGGSRIIVDSAL